MGLGYPGSESTPNKMGFDFFYGYNCQRQAHTYYPPFLYRNECREYLENKLLPPHTKLDKEQILMTRRVMRNIRRSSMHLI